MATKSTATHPLRECYEQRKKDLLFPGYSHSRLSFLKTSHPGAFPAILQHEFPSLHTDSPARASSSSLLHELPKADISFHWNHAGQTPYSLLNHNQLSPKIMHSHMAGLFPKLFGESLPVYLLDLQKLPTYITWSKFPLKACIHFPRIMIHFLIFPCFVTAGLLGPHGKVIFGRSYAQDMKENQIQVVLVHQGYEMSGADSLRLSSCSRCLARLCHVSPLQETRSST